ncbi:Beta-lactamase-like protein 2 [Pleurostoma richardsiae]|uniref:Beta-lactamase-like protein 2 n=1 Tax=Pleurostoma richardsiae TaxID=41990 RepID=A0AA38REM7_9PEZI|nr:Beta-lactamase-like protein 2 [Pleurostoma richardsiae]
MSFLWWLICLSYGLVPTTQASTNCPLYGPLFPKLGSIRQSSEIREALNTVEQIAVQYVDNSTSSGAGSYSYSFEIFAGSEPESIWTHYWTANDLRSMNTTGVRKVDGNTVYRLGSVTKVFTVLTYLAQVGNRSWNDPVTNYIPELERMAATRTSSIFNPDWDSITIGSLASQMSGLIRDYSLLGELTQELGIETPVKLGFPPLPLADIPPCGEYPVCDRQQTFAGLARAPPSFSSFTTAAYSDVGFQLLSYALQNMTGKDFGTMISESILQPLNLTRTFYTTPDDALGVIPGNRFKTTWAGDMGDANPTGNMYASSSDLATFGRAILNSKLIPTVMTRRWLKPLSSTSDPQAMVGSPWGVRKLNLGQTYQYATEFNKAGSIGRYSALFSLIPELDIGLVLLASGNVGANLGFQLADTVGEVLVPALLEAARQQAQDIYGGTYTSSDSSTNSSLTISTDPVKPGLGVTRWISNNTDMLPVAVGIQTNTTQADWDKLSASVRLYPTGLEDTKTDGSKYQAFKAVFENLAAPNVTGNPFTTDCSTWVGITSVVYGSMPLDQFVFNLDQSGRVVSVEALALRNTLSKSKGT